MAEAGTRVAHVLVVPDDVTYDEVVALAGCVFVGARPLDDDGEPVAAGGTRAAALVGTRAAVSDDTAPDDTGNDAPTTLRLSRHSQLSGPWHPAAAPAEVTEALAEVGAETTGRLLYVARTLRERTAPVPFRTGDRDGLRRTFHLGAPDREEGRVVTWLVAAARRLTGSLVLDVAPRGAQVTRSRLVPDPSVDTDLTLVSDVWLTPQAALALARQVHPHAELGATGFEWDGPPPSASSASTSPASTGGVDHDALDETDLRALAAPPPLEGYAVVLPVAAEDPVAGTVAVEVTGIATPPPALRRLAWLAGGGVQYALRWYPFDDEAAHRERPSAAVRLARREAAALVVALARALHPAVGGEVLDQPGFPVDVRDL